MRLYGGCGLGCVPKRKDAMSLRTDPNQSRYPALPNKFSLTVEREAGLWYITSPDIRGLLVAEARLFNAMRSVPGAIQALAEAKDARANRALGSKP
jgi:hypothetical protein